MWYVQYINDIHGIYPDLRTLIMVVGFFFSQLELLKYFFFKYCIQAGYVLYVSNLYPCVPFLGTTWIHPHVLVQQGSPT